MKFARFTFLLLFSVCLTSCGTQTGAAFKNMFPGKMLDQTASEVLGWLGENNLPTDGKPASIQERARQIESRGSYAGHLPAAVTPSRVSVVAR